MTNEKREWRVNPDMLKHTFGDDLHGVLHRYATTHGEHIDRLIRNLSDDFRSIPDNENASSAEIAEYGYWLEDMIQIDNDFADILEDPEAVKEWRRYGMLFDDRPKSLRKRFFNKLRHWALALERRRAYRRGMAEVVVIIDQYRKSPDKFIDGVGLPVALKRRQNQLWKEWNGRGFRLSTWQGFEAEWQRRRPEISRIVDR